MMLHGFEVVKSCNGQVLEKNTKEIEFRGCEVLK